MIDTNELEENVARIGAEVARAHAADVDVRARFPIETIDSLRQAGALGAAVPQSYGGVGASTASMVRMCRSLGAHCAASGMVLAMHHIQVMCIARHSGDSQQLAEYLRLLVREQRLIASVTSEVGPGGNLRQSIAAVEVDGDAGDRVRLEKHATTISYGAHADDLLLTARKHPEAAPGEQVAMLALRGDYELLDGGSWDTLGMRGTCSPGARVVAVGDRWQILPEPFGDIAGRTMVPASHLLWSGVWLGIVDDAVSMAARAVRKRARNQPGQVPGSVRALESATRQRRLLAAQLEGLADRYDALCAGGDPDALTQLGFVIACNDLKLNVSTVMVDIVTSCMRAIGIMAYRNDSPNSLGRHLRDAHSAALMVNNDRIEDTNHLLLLVYKGE